MITLSVLVPTIWERQPPDVLGKLVAMARAHPEVEVLWLGDDRRRSIGLKRQSLLSVAGGIYVAFVDDDDDVADDYLARMLPRLLRRDYPAVLTFDAVVRHADGQADCYLECEAGAPNEQIKPGGTVRRAAWHIHAWRADVARQSRFPDLMWGEDWVWAEPLQARAHPSARIAAPLYFYTQR